MLYYLLRGMPCMHMVCPVADDYVMHTPVARDYLMHTPCGP